MYSTSCPATDIVMMLLLFHQDFNFLSYYAIGNRLDQQSSSETNLFYNISKAITCLCLRSDCLYDMVSDACHLL